MRSIVITVILLSFTLACQPDTEPVINMPPEVVSDGTTNLHLTLGNPTNATNDPEIDYNYLVLKSQYVASYNTSLGGPNWTAWHVGRTDLGAVTRRDDFRPDDMLPASFYKVKPTDYTAEYGFDRGHMCPSADRTNTVPDNSATFLMSNIVPQAPELNRGVWAEFEAFCREQVYEGNEVYVYAGSYGVFGTGSKGTFRNIANGRITVPANYYKVVLILPEGEGDLNRINENTTVIAVDMPNNQGTKDKNWEDYITSPFNVEVSANVRFWSKISSTVKEKLRYKRYSTKPVVTPPPSTTTATSSGCGTYNGKRLYRGPQGGCYYINSNGNKTYVDRSYCTC